MESEQRSVELFLERVQEARFDINRCRGKLERAEALCERITQQISGAPGGGGDRHKDAAWAALADQRTMLLQTYKEALKTEMEVEQFIQQLESPLHRMILKLHYVDLMRWPKVLEMLEKSGTPYSERHMFRHRDAALDAAQVLWERQNEAKAPPMNGDEEEEHEDRAGKNENI